VADVGAAAWWCLKHPQESIGHAFALYAERSNSRSHAAAMAAYLDRPVACAQLHPWLTRLFLGRDLARMVRFLHADRNASLPMPSVPMEFTAFSQWLKQSRYAR